MASSEPERPRYTQDDLRPGDWIKYNSGYGGGRLAEVHSCATLGPSGVYAITTDGNVPLRLIIEIRRLPTNVVPITRRESS
jgi:hypothetical protein